jgi:hypothetical protein
MKCPYCNENNSQPLSQQLAIFGIVLSVIGFLTLPIIIGFMILPVGVITAFMAITQHDKNVCKSCNKIF